MFGMWVTSKASRACSSTAASNAAWRSDLRSAATKTTHECLQGEQVALGAESGHHANREVRDHRVSALRLAREDVGQVQLDERNAHRQERIAQRETRMSQ